MTHYLGIDVGTSAVKAVVTGEDQCVLASASAPLSVSRPHPLWSEQMPDAWWSATLSVLGDLGRALPHGLSRVAAMGLSGQMHGAVLLGAGGRPLRPAILWNDGRAFTQCEQLAAAGASLAEIAGVAAMPGFTAPKLMWLREHEPAVFRDVAHVLLPKDYVRWRLAGVAVTDCSDAAGTYWLDQARRTWSDRLLTATGMPPGAMPGLAEGTEIAGHVSPEAARETGLPPGIPIAGGGGDAAAGAAGIGAIADGDAFVSLGTSAQYFVASDRYRPAPREHLHAFCHCVPGRWYVMAALLNGASCLAWVAGLLGETDIAALLRRTEMQLRARHPEMFLPYLAGERTPHNDPHARGVFFGLGTETGAPALVQSVLEGVAFALAEAQSCLGRAGANPHTLAVIGGGSRSDLWMRILASALGRTLVRYEGADVGPAFGAARLARIALTGERPEQVCTRPAVRDTFVPDPDLATAYAPAAERFRRLYRILADEFRGLSTDS